MKSMIAKLGGICGALLLMMGSAQAQGSGATDTAGYIEAVAQSAFGNVTSQSFGVEGGYNVAPRVRIFAEIGLARDTAPTGLGQSAQLIAGYLTQVQPATVAYKVAQPVRIAGVGIKYVFPQSATIEPYVLGGFGLANVKRDVSFKIAGADVTSNIGQYGVALGQDLSGSVNKGMLTLGGGVMWSLTKSAVEIERGLIEDPVQSQPRRRRRRRSILTRGGRAGRAGEAGGVPFERASRRARKIPTCLPCRSRPPACPTLRPVQPFLPPDPA